VRQRIGIAVHAVKSSARHFGRRVAGDCDAAATLVFLAVKRPGMVGWTFLFTAATFGVVIYDVFWLTRPQVIHQEEVQSRRPSFSIRHDLFRDEGGTEYVRFNVYNNGDKAATGFEMHVLLPTDAPVEPPKNVTAVKVGGVSYYDMTEMYVYSLHPGRTPYQFRGVKLKRDEATRPFHVLWYITSAEDGTFPGKQRDGSVKYGRIEVDVKGQ
jgi:hypothetical protein